MSYIKKNKTRSGIVIAEFEKSITIDSQVLFNGYPFNSSNIRVIREAIDSAYEKGMNVKIDEIKKVLNLK